uniref:Proteasome subunit alpha type n=1 Tax=Hyaloperonospora arabidopsidis (strain Emoy2) TaxID=559515 RepID=M4BV28_HYAAE
MQYREKHPLPFVAHSSTTRFPEGRRSQGLKAKMFQTNTEYDRGVNTFSPEGRLFQVEYAIEAIKMGTTAIGIRSKEGVVLAVEKRLTSPLLEPSRSVTE